MGRQIRPFARCRISFVRAEESAPGSDSYRYPAPIVALRRYFWCASPEGRRRIRTDTKRINVMRFAVEPGESSGRGYDQARDGQRFRIHCNDIWEGSFLPPLGVAGRLIRRTPSGAARRVHRGRRTQGSAGRSRKTALVGVARGGHATDDRRPPKAGGRKHSDACESASGACRTVPSSRAFRRLRLRQRRKCIRFRLFTRQLASVPSARSGRLQKGSTSAASGTFAIGRDPAASPRCCSCLSGNRPSGPDSYLRRPKAGNR